MLCSIIKKNILQENDGKSEKLSLVHQFWYLWENSVVIAT